MNVHNLPYTINFPLVVCRSVEVVGILIPTLKPRPLSPLLPLQVLHIQEMVNLPLERVYGSPIKGGARAATNYAAALFFASKFSLLPHTLWNST